MNFKRIAAAVGVGAFVLLAASTLSNSTPADIQANTSGGAGQTVMPAASGTNITATSTIVTGPPVSATFFGKG